MIQISVDEGVAFDMLSILEVKANRGGVTHKAITQLNKEIASAIGEDLFTRIMASDEYSSLYNTNATLFDLIDDIKVRGEQLGDAIRVDELNRRRYQGKRALQSSFFPDNPMNEIKLGYSK